MEKALYKLKEAALLRSDAAKQEAQFWEKIAEAVEEWAESKDTYIKETQQYKPDLNPKPRPSKNGYLNTQETAEYLGLRPNTLSVWRVTGAGPKFVKVGGRVRYKLDDIESFTSENTFPHTTAYLNK